MITNFYGLEDNKFNLCRNIDTYLGFMPHSIIPIAEVPGGNLICIGVKNNVFEKIYLWSHENELEAYKMLYPNKIFSEIDKYWNNVYKVADSFLEFINTFIIVKIETTKEQLDEIEISLNDEDFFKD